MQCIIFYLIDNKVLTLSPTVKKKCQQKNYHQLSSLFDTAVTIIELTIIRFYVYLPYPSVNLSHL